jgi:S1-C subfamily serine protease
MVFRRKKNKKMEENNISSVEAESNTILLNEKKPKKVRRGYGLVIAISLLLFIFLAGGIAIGFVVGGISKQLWSDSLNRKWSQFFPGDKKEAAVLKQQIIEDDSAVIDVVEKNSPAVVSIVITKDIASGNGLFGSDFGFPGFFGNNGNGIAPDNNASSQKQKVGGGSGFIITTDGMIITNKHVITDKNAQYAVMTSDGKEYPAKFLAADPVNDIALIKIEGTNFPILSLGDSDAIKIGQTVIAIGNSLGEFSNTVSKGIVSGLGRSLTATGGIGQAEKLTNIIQTDAAINPGNSGGPLLNINGEVIGVNVAMAQGAQSIGFAIPSNQIKKVVEQVKTTGKISSPYLGVRYVEIDENVKKEFSFAYDYGVLIVRGGAITDFAVIPGSPADKAGLMENDVILEINDVKIDKKNSLIDVIARNNVGDTVKLKVWHKGDIKDVMVQLMERN